MEENANKCDSLRVNGAFVSPSVLIAKGSMELSENIDIFAKKFLEMVNEEINTFLETKDVVECIFSGYVAQDVRAFLLPYIPATSVAIRGSKVVSQGVGVVTDTTSEGKKAAKVKKISKTKKVKTATKAKTAAKGKKTAKVKGGLKTINKLDDLLVNPSKLAGVSGNELYEYLIKKDIT